MYPKHCDLVLELSLDIMLQPNKLHEKISSTYQIDKYLTNKGPKSNPINQKFENGLWTYRNKIYIPEKLCLEVINQYYNKPLTGHFGRDHTLKLLCHEYQWSNMTGTVAMYTKSCQLCGQNKPIIHTLYSNLIPLPSQAVLGRELEWT